MTGTDIIEWVVYRHLSSEGNHAMIVGQKPTTP